MPALGQRLTESLRALHEVFANPDLRRLEFAWAGSNVGNWAYFVAVSVFAYEEDGAAAVGIVGFVRLAASALAAPIAGLIADRSSRKRIMVGADLARAIALTLAAVAVLFDAPAVAVYALVVVVAVASSAFHPAQAALLPSLARSPEELTAANVVSSTIESVGMFVGPALGGLLLALSGTDVVFAATAATFVWSAFLVVRIRGDRRDEAPAPQPASGLLAETAAGFRAIASEANLRLLVGLFGAQTFVGGLLNVLIVVVALELLALNEAGVGYLNSAVGVGGIVGAVGALSLVGGRLASRLGFGLVLWGLPLILIAAWPKQAAVLVLLALVGVGNTLVDVAGFTLLQRAVSDDVLARVFGVLETVVLAAIAVGSLVAPVLVSLLGTRGALVASGAILPVLAVVAWPRLRAIDASAREPARELAILRSLPIFRSLPTPTLETLATRLVPVAVAPGETVCRQGEEGDRFYIVAAGELEVAVDGRPGRTIDAGDVFGEISLLRDVPRTATVTARTQAELLALDRDDFIGAVTGHPASAEAADAVVSARLSSLRPSVASL